MKRAALKLPSAPMLMHFTRASARGSALDNLAAILSAGVIRAARRMVRGQTAAVCLFDAPLAELKSVLDRRNRRRYEPFGLAIDKRYAFRMGARPVIYLPSQEAERILEPAQYWRVVSMDLSKNPPLDWSFEREWRIASDLPLEPSLLAALVETWRDADEIYERFGGRPPCAGVIPLAELFGRGA
jgi:hypothetical protein